ncbi:MAG: hypothetical protein SOT18_01675 [Eubacterium sp.]|nr:hypothetical protein [Eubacterium sp.]
MAWCPKCRNEYVEGVTVCADCQVPLVDELPEETPFDDKVLLGTLDSAEEALKVAKFLNFKGVSSAFAVTNENETEYPVYVDETEKVDARMALSQLLKEQTEDQPLSEFIPEITSELQELDEEEAEHMFSDLRTEQSSVYVKKKDKYDDLLFSGLSFIIFSVIGGVVLLLNQIGIFSFFNLYSTVVMGVVFIIFLGIGITSLVRARKTKALVTQEHELSDEVITWIEENITNDLISSYYNPEDSEENNYFTVHSRLCDIVSENFPFFPKEYIDELMDERYNTFCEGNGSEQE